MPTPALPPIVFLLAQPVQCYTFCRSLPPIVDSWYSKNCPLTKRSTNELFPTAESPSNTSLNWKTFGAATIPALRHPLQHDRPHAPPKRTTSSPSCPSPAPACLIPRTLHRFISSQSNSPSFRQNHGRRRGFNPCWCRRGSRNSPGFALTFAGIVNPREESPTVLLRRMGIDMMNSGGQEASTVGIPTGPARRPKVDQRRFRHLFGFPRRLSVLR
eukprot:COSAG02_NODE_3425_length_6768_cov_9.839106_4_plen_215_part_00